MFRHHLSGPMLTVRFQAADLAQVRFAISPLSETLLSIRVLDDPAGHALHLPWIAQARARTQGLSLDSLRALQPEKVYGPDFVSPPPTRPLAEFEDELADMVATPGDQIRQEIEDAYRGRDLPAVLEPFIADPSSAVVALADTLRAYWGETLAAHWPRIRSVLEGDVLYRARQIADGGAQRLFADVDPSVAWSDGVLRIDKPFEESVELGGRGLLFVPSVFVWPRVLAITDERWQRTLIYPARGVGLLWEPAAVSGPEAAAALLGRVRAAVLASLDQPRSTTDVARVVEVSPSGASQHLSVLRNAGLVSAQRAGRVVLYFRTPVGDSLLGAATSARPS